MQTKKIHFLITLWLLMVMYAIEVKTERLNNTAKLFAIEDRVNPVYHSVAGDQVHPDNLILAF